MSNDQVLAFLTEFRSSIEKSNTDLANNIRHEVAYAIDSMNKKQSDFSKDLLDTKEKCEAIAIESKDTRVQLHALQKEFSSFKQNLPIPQVPTNAAGRSFPITPPITNPPSDNVQAISVLQAAKRVLGFTPIEHKDILYLQDRLSCSVDTRPLDSDSLRIEAIREFLTDEMKIPRTVADSLLIARTFTPARQSENWSTLYAEFTSASSVDLINQYVNRLKPGKSVNIYVPHSLYPRFQSINSIAHSYRNGAIKHKTKVRYGPSDFELLIKPREGVSRWTYAPLDHLPPLELSPFDGNISSSPAPGRTRLPSKRSRDSPEIETRSNKTRTDLALPSLAPCSDATAPVVNQQTLPPPSLDIEVVQINSGPNILPSGSNSTGARPKCNTSSSPLNDDEFVVSESSPELKKNEESKSCASTDLGTFLPSAGLSPSVAQNQNFDFSHRKSAIPRPRSSLN